MASSRRRRAPESVAVSGETQEAESVRVHDDESPESVAARLTAESESESATGDGDIAAGEVESDLAQPAQPRGRGGWPKGKPRGPRKGAAKKATAARSQQEEIEEAIRDIQQQAQIIAPVLYHTISMGVPDYTEEKALQLASAIIPVAQKYGDSALAEYLPEITLVGVVIAQFGNTIFRRRTEPRREVVAVDPPRERVADAAYLNNGG